MAEKWYYWSDEKEDSIGPFTRADLAQMVTNGELKSDDLVWKSGFGDDWKSVSAV